MAAKAADKLNHAEVLVKEMCKACGVNESPDIERMVSDALEMIRSMVWHKNRSDSVADPEKMHEEVDAMKAIGDLLDAFDEASRERILNWVHSKYYPWLGPLRPKVEVWGKTR